HFPHGECLLMSKCSGVASPSLLFPRVPFLSPWLCRHCHRHRDVRYAHVPDSFFIVLVWESQVLWRRIVLPRRSSLVPFLPPRLWQLSDVFEATHACSSPPSRPLLPLLRFSLCLSVVSLTGDAGPEGLP
ncbi:unnamed protein product, partial [Closterium sp. NIES-53]